MVPLRGINWRSGVTFRVRRAEGRGMLLSQASIVREWSPCAEYRREGNTIAGIVTSFIFIRSISPCYSVESFFDFVYELVRVFDLYTRNIKIFNPERRGDTALRNNVFDSRSNSVQSGVLLVRCARRSVSVFLVPLCSYFSIFIRARTYTRVTKARGARIFRVRHCEAFPCNGIRLKTSKFKWKYRRSF